MIFSARMTRARSSPASSALLPASAPPTPTRLTTTTMAISVKRETCLRVRARSASTPSPETCEFVPFSGFAPLLLAIADLFQTITNAAHRLDQIFVAGR